MATQSSNVPDDLVDVGVIGEAPAQTPAIPNDLEDFGTVGNTPLAEDDHALAAVSALNRLKENPLDADAQRVVATQKRLFGESVHDAVAHAIPSAQPEGEQPIVPLSPEASAEVSSNLQEQASKKDLGEYLTKSEPLIKATELNAAQEMYNDYLQDPVAHPMTEPELARLNEILQDGRSWERRFADEAGKITFNGVKSAAAKTWEDIKSSFENDDYIKRIRSNPLNIVNPAVNLPAAKNIGAGLIAGGARLVPSVTDLLSQGAQATIGSGIGKISPEAEQKVDAHLNAMAGVVQAGFGDAATRLEKITGAEGQFTTGVGEQVAPLLAVGGSGAGAAIEKIAQNAPKVVEGAKAGIYKAASKTVRPAAAVGGLATKAGIGYAVGESMGHGTIGAIFALLARRGTHSASEAVGQIAKTKLEQLAADASAAMRAKAGQSGVEAIREAALTGVKDADAKAAEYLSRIKTEEAVNLKKTLPSGEPMYTAESPGLSSEAKEVLKQRQLAQDLRDKAEMLRGKIRSERRREWLLGKAVEIPLKSVEGAAVISGLGAASAPVNQGAEAVEHGIPVGLAYGAGGSLVSLPSSYRENQLATNRAYLHDFARTNLSPKGLGVIESMPEEHRNRILSQIGESVANGTKVSALTTEEIAARLPEGTEIPNGWYKDGEIVLNIDRMATGVESHEAFHPYFEQARKAEIQKRAADIAERFRNPKTPGDAAGFSAFKSQYAAAKKANDPETYANLTPEDLAEEALAEGSRLLAHQMPAEYFYGGRGIGGKLSDWINRAANFIAPGRGVTVPGFDAPLTQEDMLSLKQFKDEQGKSAKAVIEGGKEPPKFEKPAKEAPKPSIDKADVSRPEPVESIEDFHGKLMPAPRDALESPAVRTDEDIIVKGGSHFEAKKAAKDLGLSGATVGFTTKKGGFKTVANDEALNHGQEIGQLPEEMTSLSDASFADNRKFMPSDGGLEKASLSDKEGAIEAGLEPWERRFLDLMKKEDQVGFDGLSKEEQADSEALYKKAEEKSGTFDKWYRQAGGRPKSTPFMPSLKVQKDGTAKAWIDPEGKVIPLKGEHAGWFQKNQEEAKRLGIENPKKITDDPESKGIATQKGFTRINITRSGEARIGVNEKQWPKVRDQIQDLVNDNIDSVTRVDISLLDENNDVVGGEEANVFRDPDRVNSMDIWGNKEKKDLGRSLLERRGLAGIATFGGEGEGKFMPSIPESPLEKSDVPNLGAPKEGFVPWEPTEGEVKSIKEGAQITPAAKWDNMTKEQRKVANPDWNPDKRYFEQKGNKVTPSKFMPASNDLKDHIARVPIYKLDSPNREEHGWTQYQTTAKSDEFLSHARDKDAKFAKLDNPLVMVGNEQDIGGFGWKPKEDFLEKAAKDGHDGVVIISPWAFPKEVYSKYPSFHDQEALQKGIDFANEKPNEVDWEHKDNKVIPLDDSKISDQGGFTEDEMLDRYNEGKISKEDLTSGMGEEGMNFIPIEAAKDKVGATGKIVHDTDEMFWGKAWPKLLKSTDLTQSPKSEKGINTAAGNAVKDVHKFLQDNPRFADYYNKDWAETQKALEEHYGHPMSEDAMSFFKLAKGLTSPNTALDINVNDALKVTDHWMKEGDLDAIKMGVSKLGNRVLAESPFTISGTTNSIKAFTLKAIDNLSRAMKGPKQVADYLREPVGIEELEAFNKSLGYKGKVGKLSSIKELVRQATGQDEKIPRMFVFGRKVGAYTLNLLGDHAYNTVDIWEYRFIRSQFKDLFKKSADYPVNVDEHALFAKFTDAFNKSFNEQTGMNLDNSALQAARWFYVIDAARAAGYTGTTTSETISHYVRKNLEKKNTGLSDATVNDPF